MTDSNKDQNSWRIDRRRFVGGIGVAASVGLAGCPSGDGTATPSDDGGGSSGNTDDGGGNESDTEDFVRGGMPVVGQAQGPNHLNVVKGGNAYGDGITLVNYTRGTVISPETGQYIPWGFSDYTLNVDNIGTDDPAIVAEVREGLTFHDGEPVTAEDVSFTYKYLQEQQPAGNFVPRGSVDSVQADSPEGSTVSYFLNQRDSAYLSDILGQVFLPKHIWQDVSNYNQYAPRQEDEVIGSGPLQVTDFNWPSWVEMEMRPREEIPYYDDDRYTWLDDEGPFIDGVRFQVFESRSSLFQAVLDGRVDQTYQTVLVDQAIEADQQDDNKVIESSDNAYHFHGFNTRRVPLDDPVFRQFLSKSLNQRWVIQQNYKNVGAERGNYHVHPVYGEYRPPDPDEADSFEGIELPDLNFPGDTLQQGVNTRQEDVEELRDFLIDHPDAIHDYSLGNAQASSDFINTRDGQAIYVNGEPIGQAHTDNNGNPGQGPLEFSQGPPEADPVSYPRADSHMKTLRRIGVPIERSLDPWDTQYPKMYINEKFDIYEQIWPDTPPSMTYLQTYYGGSNADVDNTVDDPMWNGPGYTGADDLMEQMANAMDVEERKPIVQKIAAKLYRDQPQMVTSYPAILDAVTTAYTGRVPMVGGVTNIHSYLNMRKTA